MLSNVIKFFQSLASNLNQEGDCFILIKSSSVWNILIYSVIILITDYSVILSALYLFYRKGKGMKSEVIHKQVRINSSFDADLELEQDEEEDKTPRRRRSESNSSLKDYILYSS